MCSLDQGAEFGKSPIESEKPLIGSSKPPIESKKPLISNNQQPHSNKKEARIPISLLFPH
ncbi:hypothetical protein JOC78_002854 [Bacillus ectoiniformans]|nr:hypothetical protein [Bacillus ectoiniformans]